MNTIPADAAQIGRMFVTDVHFVFVNAGSRYNDKTGKYDKLPAHWQIAAKLSSKPDASCYDKAAETMTLTVEQGIGQKLVEVLLPVVIADASRKAQQLADESKAALIALGERAKLCITDMPPAVPDNKINEDTVE